MFSVLPRGSTQNLLDYHFFDMKPPVFSRWQQLLHPDAQAFLAQNAQTPLHKIAFLKSKTPNIPFPEVLEQLDSLRKVVDKIPAWAGKDLLLLPSLAFQQASSAHTAAYKSTLLQGERIADLTGGLGIDSFFFAQNRQEVWHIEPELDLHKLARHNFEQLKQTNVVFSNQTAEQFLQEDYGQFDAIYIDPARRGKEGRKLVLLADYSPNVMAILHQMFEKTAHVWLKTSPLLDITQACQVLACVTAVYVVAHGQEVKELLFHLTPPSIQGRQGDIKIHAVTLEKVKQHHYTFLQIEESEAMPLYSFPLRYIYEPLPAILKAGAFKSFAKTYNLAKLHVNSHFYTSETLLTDIPARVFEVKKTCAYQKKAVKEALPAMKANIIARNFRNSVAEIRQKLDVIDGGEQYLLATTTVSGEQVILVVDRLFV